MMYLIWKTKGGYYYDWKKSLDQKNSGGVPDYCTNSGITNWL